MKNFLFLLIAAIAFISCEDTQTNKVALQAKINDRLYISNDARAILNEDNSLTIQGFTEDESLTIHLYRLRKGNYAFNQPSSNYAIFEDKGGNVFTTRPDSEGIVTISKLSETKKTITGTFYFRAILPDVDTIYISKGVFYDVSFADGDIGDPTNAGKFSANIDGNPFVSIIVGARDTGNSIAITGSSVNATISLTLPKDVAVGDYTLPTGGFQIKYRDDNGSQNAGQGIINILAHDINAKTISGTFSFSTDSHSITNGSFSVTYI